MNYKIPWEKIKRTNTKVFDDIKPILGILLLIILASVVVNLVMYILVYLGLIWALVLLFFIGIAIQYVLTWFEVDL